MESNDLPWQPSLTCKHFKSIIDSEEFREFRLNGGFAENVIVAYAEHPYTEKVRHVWVLLDGRWRQTTLATSICPFQFPAIRAPTVCTTDSTRGSILLMGNKYNTCSSQLRFVDGVHTSLPPYPVARQWPSVVHVGKCTIVAGGHNWDTQKVTSSVVIFDPQVGKWNDLPHLPHAVNRAAAGVVSGKIYVAGGANHIATKNPDYWSRHFQIYDIALKCWEEGPPLPESLGAISGAVVNGKFHIIGKSLARQIWTCFVFHEDVQLWTETSPVSSIFDMEYLAIEHGGRLLALHVMIRYPAVISYALELEDSGVWSNVSLKGIPDLTEHLENPYKYHRKKVIIGFASLKL